MGAERVANRFSLGCRLRLETAGGAHLKSQDRAWVADIPDLQYCSALGATPEQAVAEVEKARDLWLEVARQDGRPIPEPVYRPAPAQAS